MMHAARPTDRTVYRVHRGRIGKGTVRSRLPGDVAQSTRFVAAARMPHADATLAAVHQVATRCAPWLRVYLGPQLWSIAHDGEDVSAFADLRELRDGRIFHRLGGQAWRTYDVVLVSGWTSMSNALATLHHEIWHAIEDDLHPEDLAIVEVEMNRGIRLPGAYLDSHIERRARAYDAWAQAWDEGWRPATACGVPLRRIDRIWRYVHGGQLAADRAAGRPILPRLLPGQATSRSLIRGLQRVGKAILATVTAWPLVLFWPLAAAYFMLHR